MLDIKIFNVDYGFCAAINVGSRHTILLDCGYSVQTGFRPIQHIFQQRDRSLDGVILPAYSKHHLSALPDFLAQCLEYGLPVNSLIANPSLQLDQFPELAVSNRRLNNMLSLVADVHPECLKISHSLTVNGIKMTFFWNNYPDFQNIHDLSLVTFLSYRDLHIIFPGDLETEGWQALLQCTDFCDRLRKVNTFIASDHGQEEGYCPEVFHYCTPEVIIISNQADRSVSPKMLRCYESHLKPSPLGVCEKPLLTTREDGVITIKKFLDAARRVTTQPQIQSYYR